MCDSERDRLLKPTFPSKHVSIEAASRASHCEMLAGWARDRAKEAAS